jgi:hypothetical protein
LTLSADGKLTGTITAAGTYQFSIVVTDSTGAKGNLGPIHLTAYVPLKIDMSTPPPSGTKNVPYSYQFKVTGGVSPYLFTVSSGNLPTGLTISSTGALGGTPTTTGQFNFTVTVTDANHKTVTGKTSQQIK